MLALLKLIPIKDWIYTAIIALLLVAFLRVYHDGEQRIETKDKALRAAATALNVAASNLADIKEIQIGHTYEHYIALPAVADAPGLVCHNAAPVKSQAPDDRPEAPATAAQLPDGGFNPSGELLTLLRDDDAQIAGLIDTVLNLQAELEGQTK